jgi:hypothetical protein
MMTYPKLYIGPMSKNIVDAAIELNMNLGFCASRRQIEYNGGYVNNWTTASFVKYVKKRSSDILIIRDHGGPGQGAKEDNGFDSFKHDIKLVDIIHIDPWKKFHSLENGIDKTAEYIEFCNKLNTNCMYEVSTEEAIRKITHDELYIFLKKLKNKLGKVLFNKILYAVIQSGTSLKEDRNTGTYDEIRLKKMIEVCKEFNVLSKEHNGDYLSSTIIKEKFDLGLDAINIAPEFGIIETLCILNRLSNNDKTFNKIYQMCYESGKWKKWVSDDFDPDSNKKQTVKICCHYIFSDERFKRILSSKIFDGINEEIKSRIKSRTRDIVGKK